MAQKYPELLARCWTTAHSAILLLIVMLVFWGLSPTFAIAVRLQTGGAALAIAARTLAPVMLGAAYIATRAIEKRHRIRKSAIAVKNSASPIGSPSPSVDGRSSSPTGKPSLTMRTHLLATIAATATGAAGAFLFLLSPSTGVACIGLIALACGTAWHAILAQGAFLLDGAPRTSTPSVAVSLAFASYAATSCLAQGALTYACVVATLFALCGLSRIAKLAVSDKCEQPQTTPQGRPRPSAAKPSIAQTPAVGHLAIERPVAERPAHRTHRETTLFSVYLVISSPQFATIHVNAGLTYLVMLVAIFVLIAGTLALELLAGRGKNMPLVVLFETAGVILVIVSFLYSRMTPVAQMLTSGIPIGLGLVMLASALNRRTPETKWTLREGAVLVLGMSLAGIGYSLVDVHEASGGNGNILFFFHFVSTLLLAICLVACALQHQSLATKDSPVPTVGPSSEEAALNRLASRHGLTPRLRLLLGCLAEGRNVPYIAAQLSLSENTVRTYKKELYGLLDIHSQQDLIDMVQHERNECTERNGQAI